MSASADFGSRNAQAWWRGAVVYQIYPRSFLDTNGDGVGDLKGVIEKLDYVANLGVDGVWLSPFFTSPMKDFGYDVADYRGVDPVFGTLKDFDRLIEKAHALNLKVIIDQVYSHTSDQHAWFLESRKDKTNPKADWYVWADAKPGGSPPNNWLSVFGGCAWTWDSRRKQYYLHNFLTSQPDLNLHNIEVQNALLEVARFWLERGVDGFRLDAINYAMHDPLLRDNPPAPKGNPPSRWPYDDQLHIYNRSHPNVPNFLERLRVVTDEYDGIFTVAEVVGLEAAQEMKSFTKTGKRLNTAYSFDFLYADELTPALLKKTMTEWSGDPIEDGWPAWAFSNHDAPRAVSRWAREQNAQQAAKLYVMLLLCLRGNVFLYQGEELGLPQAVLDFEDLKDPEAIANWPETLGRDGARTPMPWVHDAINAGFSSRKPWLPVFGMHPPLSVDVQEQDKHSVLNFVRDVIVLRRGSPALLYGATHVLDAPGDCIAFHRRHDDEELLCVFNLGQTEVRWTPPNSNKFHVILNLIKAKNNAPRPDIIPPLSGYLARQIR